VRSDRTPQNEDAPADGEHVYARTKQTGEQMVREASRHFPTVAVRLGALFSDWCEFPPLYYLIETWLSRAWNARCLGGRGLTSTPYLHVRDGVSFFMRLLARMDALERSATLLASTDGAVSHRELFEAATAYALGSPARPILIPRLLVGPGLALNDVIGRMRGQRPFERPWMARYVDTYLWVNASRTRRVLGWEPHPRLGVLNRVPYMIENKRSDAVEWQRRNAEALEHRLVRPNYVVFRLARRHQEEIAAAFDACFDGPGADPALERFRTMGADERRYQAAL
jgi:nucleoside-diphosphate-sugar epimerase